MAIFNLATFFNKYKYHFLVWGIFIAYEISFKLMTTHKLQSIKEYIFAYATGIIIFYFHAHILLKYTLKTKNKLLKYSLPLFILFEITGYIIIKFLSEKYIYNQIGIQIADINTPIQLYLSLRISRCIYIIGYSTGYYFLMYDQQQRQEVEKLKQHELEKILREKGIMSELTLTQNAFLRAQINPHFLINTLSYLYNETRKQAPKAADNILSLSEIMQYALSNDISSRFVKFENEIRLVENFLLLHQARQPYRLQLKLSYTREVLAVPFVPLVLMSLTENVIRYGQLDDPLKPAKISIVYENSTLAIETVNAECIGDQMPAHNEGLKNIMRRLSLAYGERARFISHLDAQGNFHISTQVQF